MPNDVIRKLVEAHLKARPLSGDYQGLSGTITIEGEYDRAPTVGQIYELIRRNKFRWVL
jgi:hypothetical protein